MIHGQTTTTVKAGNAIVYAMQNYAGYNCWANTTLVNWLRTKPLSLMEQEVPSSFPTIRGTLVHILQTQQYWFAVISRTEFIREEFKGSTEEVFDALIAHSEHFAAYVREMTDEDLQDSTPISNPWFECNFQHFDYIIQVMNHSTYHRGQVITIGRNLGFTDAPMTDYQYYNIYGRQKA